MTGIAGEFVMLSPFSALGAFSVRALDVTRAPVTLRRSFSGVLGTARFGLRSSASSEIGDKNRLADPATMLARRSFSRDDQRVTRRG